MSRNRGDAGITLLIAIAVVGLFVSGGVKLPAFLQPKPKTAQLSKTETDLAAARAAQASAEAKLAQVQAAALAIKEQQLDYTQQMVAGARKSLDSLPSTELTTGVKLAKEFTTRADAAFTAARGALSPEARAEIDRLYGDAMQAKDHELASLQSSLNATKAERDMEATQRASLEAQIPSLRANVTVADAKTATTEAKRATLERQVSDFANQKDAADREAGSWHAYFWLAVKIGVGILLLHVICNIWLPMMAQSYPGISWIGKAANFFKNATTGHA